MRTQVLILCCSTLFLFSSMNVHMVIDNGRNMNSHYVTVTWLHFPKEIEMFLD